MKIGNRALSLVLLFVLFTLQGCFTASSRLENVKTYLMQNNDENNDDFGDTDVETVPEEEDDEFNLSIGPVTLFFTYGLVYLLSPLDEVDFDMVKDVLNNIDGLSISTTTFSEEQKMPDKSTLNKLKSELYSDGFEPVVLNREKGEINMVFISRDFDEDGGELLVVNFSENEMNLVTVKADFAKLLEYAAKYNNINFGSKFSFK